MGKYQDCFKNTPYNNLGIHLSSVPMLLHIVKDVDYNECAEAICSFTSFNPLDHLRLRFLGFHLTRKNHDIYRLQFRDKNIEFSKFSDLLIVSKYRKGLLMKLELLSRERRSGSCHFQSMFFSQYFGKRIVNAYIDDSTGKFRVVHSFIEGDKNVYDYTKNLVISKEDYYELFHVEVISTIERETLLEDIKNPPFPNLIDCKFYCLFREELQNGHTFHSGTFWKVEEKGIEKVKK